MFNHYVSKYMALLTENKTAVMDVETALINLDKNQTLFTHRPEFVLGAVDSSVYKTQIVFSAHVMSLVENTILVGHNISYDLLYLSVLPMCSRFFIWDTMIAEYLMTGQEETTPSLNRLAEKYGLPGKQEEVSDLIKAGVCPSTIDPELLKKYLLGDISLTRDVFEKQLEIFTRNSVPFQRTLISQMLFRINTLTASINGMTVDVDTVEKLSSAVQSEVLALEAELQHDMADYSGVLDYQWNPASPKDLMTFFNGGTVTVTRRVPVGTYKTGAKAGKTRFKLEADTREAFGTIYTVRSTDEKALKELSRIATGGIKEFIEKLLEYRDKSKTLNTYLTGYANFAKYDGRIHPTYNHGVTPTGRLTCNKPNLQNIKG